MGARPARPRHAKARAPRPTRASKPAAVDLGPLSASVGYGLQRAQLAARSAVVAALAKVDLSPTRFAVLNVIERNPGLSQKDTCAALGIQATNFTPLLHDLERRGLIARRISPTSRRTNMLDLTPAGKRLLERALGVHSALEQRIARSLGAERRDLLLLLLEQVAALK
jgi:DNA-binding MarR family transcriptional regulator